LSRSVAGLEANLLRYGLAAKCGKVYATDIPVLKLEESAPHEVNLIRNAIGGAIEHDGADTIVLGCAGMTDLADLLSQEFAMPVVDGVVCAVTFVEALIAAGFKTSKRGGYAYPL
jgi:allantoin racemase